MWMVLRSRVPWMTCRRSSAVVSASRRKFRRRDQRLMYPEGAYWVCRPPIRSSVSTSDSEDRCSKNCRASSARLSSRSDKTRSAAIAVPSDSALGAADYGNGGGGAGCCRVVRMEQDQVPAQKNQQRK